MCSKRMLMTIVAVGLAGSMLRAEDEKKEEKAAAKAKTEKVKIGPVAYQIPADWKRQRPSSEMRVVQFGVPLAKGDDGKFEFVGFYFQGGGGSVQDNIKRWIDMFEDKDGEEKIEKSEVAGMKVTLLDVSGTYKDKPAPFVPKVTLRKDYRMLAGIVETPDDGPYYFRLVGPKKSVAEQEESWKNLFKTFAAE